MNNPTAEDINTTVPRALPASSFLHRNFLIIKNLLLGGFTGTFTTADKSITVTRGIVTNIEDLP